MKPSKWHILPFLIVLLSACSRPDSHASMERVPFLQDASPLWIDSLVHRMSIEEKLGQLIFLEYNKADSTSDDQLIQWVEEGRLGGIIPEGLSYPHFRYITDTLQAIKPIPLFIASRNKQMLHQQFSDWESPYTFTRIGNDSLRTHLQRLYAREAFYLGINMVFGMDLESNLISTYWNKGRTSWLNKYHILSGAENFQDYYPEEPDTSSWLKEVLQPTHDLIGQGLSAINIPDDWQMYCGIEQATFQTYFVDRLDFQGLLWAKVDAYMDVLCLWNQGVDQFWVQSSPTSIHRVMVAAVKNGVIREEDVNQRVTKVLRAKYWMHNGLKNPNDKAHKSSVLSASLIGGFSPGHSYVDQIREDKVKAHFDPLLWDAFHQNLDMASLVLLHHPSGDWPMLKPKEKPYWVLDFSPQPAIHFKKTLAGYLNVTHHRGQFTPGQGYSFPVMPKGVQSVVLFDGTYLRLPRDRQFMQALKSEGAIIINMGPPAAIATLDTAGVTLIQAPPRTRHIEQALAEVLMGARSIDGKLTHEINSQLGIAAGLSYAAIRLGNSDPEEVGIRGDKLLAINAIIRKAIREKAFPGCQLLVARQGRIILNKSFGTHQYATQKAVENGDLYDLASITKIAATTIGIMKAYELGMIDLHDQVGQHLPKLKGSDVGGVTIAQLLAHQSGIQPNIPLRYSILHRDSTDDTCDDYLCFEQSDLFPERAAEHIYVKNGFIDSVLARIHTIKIESGRRYRYSDVNFLLLQKILEARSGMTLEEWLSKHFYEPLDLPTMAFRPLSKFDPERIVPTERDLRWRHQLLRGYVHDEAAALLGGVAGHAGLFSNAEDLATLMQMLLNGGRYGGITFLEPTTIKLFTVAQNGSHRGLGFDKPKRGYGRNHAKYMSSMSFGHLGFTGTCVWVDPQEELIYIFLSNRIHPSIANKKLMRKGIRGKIHQVVYDALDTYSDQWPDLPDPLLPYDGRIISQVVTD